MADKRLAQIGVFLSTLDLKVEVIGRHSLRGPMKISTALLIGASLLLQSTAVAQVPIRGDVQNGREIAERWCAACHDVSSEQRSGNPDVPSFVAIARSSAEDAGRLEHFLTDPHPVMPNMNLTREEIRDIVAYILSLR